METRIEMNNVELLSELLAKRERYIEMWQQVVDDSDEQEIIGLALDCIECKLMYGDYVNDIGKEYNYWEE